MTQQPTPRPTGDAERRAGAALAPPHLAPLLRKRSGVSGTVHSGGNVHREWDRFDWLQWARQADLMRLCPRVQMAWQARASELRAAEWTAVPADHPDGERYADLVRKVLGLDALVTGKAAGTLATNRELARHYEHCGAQFVALGVDTQVLANTAKHLLQQHCAEDAQAAPGDQGNGAY